MGFFESGRGVLCANLRQGRRRRQTRHGLGNKPPSPRPLRTLKISGTVASGNIKDQKWRITTRKGRDLKPKVNDDHSEGVTRKSRRVVATTSQEVSSGFARLVRGPA